MKEFSYQVSWRSSSRNLGAHRGNQAGAGFEYLGAVPFGSQPDARYLDVKAMLADPLGQLMVKSFRQTATVPIHVVLDVSGSMGFGQKLARLTELAESIALSAWRSGDPFAGWVCDDAILWDWCVPLRRQRGLPEDWVQGLQAFKARERGVGGLLQVASQLGRQRALVFLASDFHFPLAGVQAVMEAYALHDVIPIVLWESGEYDRLPRWGLAELRDPETGGKRRLFLRPALTAQIKNAFAQRRAELSQVLSCYGREPFFLIDGFDAESMTRYFYPA